MLQVVVEILSLMMLKLMAYPQKLQREVEVDQVDLEIQIPVFLVDLAAALQEMGQINLGELETHIPQHHLEVEQQHQIHKEILEEQEDHQILLQLVAGALVRLDLHMHQTLVQVV